MLTPADAASKNPQLMDCIQSWAREVPINDIVNSSLLDTVLNGLSEDEPFESAVECICAVIRETRDVDECMNVISTLYPKLMALRPKIEQAAEEEDTEVFKGIARVFAEAGEAWVVLIARLPQQFQGLVESVLEVAARDNERDAISHTFNFWCSKSSAWRTWSESSPVTNLAAQSQSRCRRARVAIPRDG